MQQTSKHYERQFFPKLFGKVRIPGTAIHEFLVAMFNDPVQNEPLRTFDHSIVERNKDKLSGSIFNKKEWNRTSYFVGNDTLALYQKNMNDSTRRALIEKNNWTTESVTYRINDRGFRYDGEDSILKSDEPCVVYLGDSNMFGTGVNVEDSIAYKIHTGVSKFKNLRYVNLSQPGCGISTAYRVLKFNMDDLNIKYVVGGFHWAFTREEHYDQDEKDPGQRFLKMQIAPSNSPTRTPFPDFMFSEIEGIKRYYKNLDAIKWICHSNDIQLHWIEDIDHPAIKNFDPTDILKGIEDKVSRDTSHYGPQQCTRIADVICKVLNE